METKTSRDSDMRHRERYVLTYMPKRETKRHMLPFLGQTWDTCTTQGFIHTAPKRGADTQDYTWY